MKKFLLIIIVALLWGNTWAGEFVLSSKGLPDAGKTTAPMIIPLVNEAITLDGRLDEVVWAKAAVVSKWREYPTGSAFKVPARFRVMADGEMVYVGFSVEQANLEESELRKPKGTGDEYGGSLIEVFLDPTGKGESKFQFITNPLGLRYDSFNDNKKWDGKWRSSGVVRKDGWSVEMAIPLSDLGKAKVTVGELWRANFGYKAPLDLHLSWTGKWGAATSDYSDVFFGRAPVVTAERLRLGLFLDREVYDLRDVTAVAMARVEGIPHGGKLPEGLALRVRMLQGNRTVTEDVLKTLTARMDLTLGMERVPMGKGRVEVELLREGKVLSVSARDFERRVRKLIPTGAKSGRIPLIVWAMPKAAGLAWPVSAGVPFAQGVLMSPEKVRLLGPDGREVPCQTEVRALWNRRGSVKWLGVNFIPKLATKTQRYVLEYGVNIRRVGFSPMAQQSGGTIAVNTGPLKFSVNRSQFNGIHDVMLDLNSNGKIDLDEQVLRPSGGPWLIDHEGTIYEAKGDVKPEVVLEENGPMRCVIRATGWYVRKGSIGERLSCELPTDKLCKFVFRITAWRERPEIHIQVSTVLTYDSDKVRLRGLGLDFAPNVMRHVTVGAEKGPLVWTGSRLHKMPYVVQHRPLASIDDQGKTHGRLAGWATSKSEKAVMHLAVRNLSKLWPKEIEILDGRLSLQFWPRHGRNDAFTTKEQLEWHNIYKLWATHSGRELDFRFPATYKEALDDELKRTPSAFGNYYTAMEFSNAQGMCLNNELVLAFQSIKARSPMSAATVTHLIDEAPHAFADPAYACATGVFGPILHADRTRFGEIEDTLRAGSLSLMHRANTNHETGMFIHGGAHTYWWYHKKPPHAGVHRVWINGHYQIGRLPYVEYLRTGDPAYLKWGRDFTANLRDIGMVHYTSDERRFRFHTLGAMYHCKGFAPWAGDSHIAAHLISYDPLLYDYYLTGNRRSRDVFLTWVNGLKSTDPGVNPSREGIGTFAEIVEAYTFTWDAALLPLLDRCANTIFGKTPLAEQHWWDYHPLLLPRYHGLTGNRRALEAYRKVLDIPIGRGGTTHLDAYFAMLEKKPERLQRWQPWLYREALSRVDQTGIPANGLTKHAWIEHVYPAHKLPYLFKAMATYNLRATRPAHTPGIPAPTTALTTHIAFREKQDRAIPVDIKFPKPPSGPVAINIFRADGRVVAHGGLNKDTASTKITIPTDGRADDYLAIIRYTGSYDAVLLPLTPLQKEVAILSPAIHTFWREGNGGRFYFVPSARQPDALLVASNSKRAMGLELLDMKSKTIDRATDSRYVGNPQRITLPKDKGPLSIFFSDYMTLRLDGAEKMIFMGLKPEAVFTPKLTREPLDK